MKKAILTGSFDPFTLGHKDILERAGKIFDVVHVVIFTSPKKISKFSLEERLNFIKLSTSDISNVVISSSSGLVVDYMAENEIFHAVRGVRNGEDFNYEQNLSLVNKSLFPSFECVLLCSSPNLSHISSSTVRELLSYGKSVKGYVTEEVKVLLEQN